MIKVNLINKHGQDDVGSSKYDRTEKITKL